MRCDVMCVGGKVDTNDIKINDNSGMLVRMNALFFGKVSCMDCRRLW